MSKPTFAERCALSEQCLPDAPYRAMLTKLHSEMLLEIERLRTAIEQAEKQEPVAEVVEDDFSKQVVGIGRWLKLQNGTKLYTTPPAAPAAPVQEQGQSCYCPNCEVLSKQLAAQPAPVQDTEAHYKGVIEGVQKLFDDKRAQRQWVGLTQQDIDIAFDDTQEGGGFNEFARAIEAKLKEKNNG